MKPTNLFLLSDRADCGLCDQSVSLIYSDFKDVINSSNRLGINKIKNKIECSSHLLPKFHHLCDQIITE